MAGAAAAGANRQDQADRSEPAWDTAERRQQLAVSLEGKGKGDREAVRSRLLADKHQGTHPSAAVAQQPSLAETSKMTKETAAERRWSAEDSNDKGPRVGCLFVP